jgi:hypothetical protein
MINQILYRIRIQNRLTIIFIKYIFFKRLDDKKIYYFSPKNKKAKAYHREREQYRKKY